MLAWFYRGRGTSMYMQMVAKVSHIPKPIYTILYPPIAQKHKIRGRSCEYSSYETDVK